MRKWEEKLLQWVRDNLLVLFLLFVTALGLVIRYSLKDFVSRDYISCLEKWYTTSKELGIRKALATQIGNYNMSYQLLIALITKLPINPLYAYKLISCVFDYTLAGSVAALVAVCMNGRTSLWLAIQNKTDVGWYCAVGYAATLFLPTVFMNSAQWAQCDAIYVTFLLLTLIACLRERNALSMILWGVAISFKLQAVFLFPFMLWVYLARRKHSILSFFLAPAAVVCISLPNILCGRKWTNLFVIYFDQMRLNEKISLNYASFWNIIAADKSLEAYDPYKIAAICLTVFFTVLHHRFSVFEAAALHGGQQRYDRFPDGVHLRVVFAVDA